jgi:hypothetical protein
MRREENEKAGWGGAVGGYTEISGPAGGCGPGGDTAWGF